MSSSSLSSAASSMLPTAPSNSSQSDIGPPDHSVHSSPPSLSHSLNARPAHPPGLILGGPRSSSLNVTAMGQLQSRPLPTAPAAVAAVPAPPSPKTTSRFKRVFGAARRKKSDSESSSLDLPPVQPLRVKGSDARAASPARRPAPPPAPVDVPPPPAWPQKPKPHPALPSPDSAGVPPTPPPKPPHMQPTPPRTMLTTNVPRGDQRASFMMTSPVSAALEYIKANEEASPSPAPAPVSRPSQEKRDHEIEKAKEDWRKSDSTTTSYYTVRPRSGTSGTRTPRPVSMAESLQSNNTIVPQTRRMSALITDSEYATPEEDLSVESHASGSARASLSRQASPSGSAKARKRHSISLSLSSPFASEARRSPPHNGRHRAGTDGFGVPPSSDLPTLTRTAANGIIAPSRAEDFPSSTGSQIKGKLTAWSAASPPPRLRALPEPPGSPSGRSSSSSSQNQAYRQPAVSISGGLAPVAGFAMGFGRRAMERMGRAIGSLGAHAHSHASSSSSSLSGDESLGRTQSNLSAPSHHLAAPPPRGKHWRTPNAPSGAWSISTTGTGSSSVSQSDSDVLGLAAGPNLGRRRRGPMRVGGGASGPPIAGGLVFGRDLATCVRETAIEPVRLAIAGRGTLEGGAPGDPLEKRMLPALVVRCAQHLLRWGVEEEGLFRISGRASHIAKLRTEFDTGADYDLRETTPGDLDPHAVSSIFKAYLRELPEPILTHALNPYFEAAMIAETNARKGEDVPPAQPHRPGMRAPGAQLPGNPRDGHTLRKPPSLSTLAMPNFAGMRPPSASLLKAFAMLVARLPPANRDLLRTVTELINATSSRKETRMPLSNLTVIFCPSLNMNPPILRVLCESREVWEVAERAEEPVVDIKHESVLDIRPEPVFGDEGQGDDEGRTSDEQGQVHQDGVVVVSVPPVAAPAMAEPSDTKTASSDDADADTDADGDTSGLSSTLDDTASSFSSADARPATPPLYNPHSPQSTHGISSSESLATPSTLSEDSPAPLHEPYQFQAAAKDNFPHQLSIAEPESHPPLTPSEARPTPVIVAPAPLVFPCADAPQSPSSTVSPSASPALSSPAGSTHSRTRMKRPSLSALFNKKRSASSLGSARASMNMNMNMSAAPLPPRPLPSPTDSSSPGTPLSAGSSMVTAPMGSASASGSRFSLPPLLDTKIDSSSLSLVLGIEETRAPLPNPHSPEDVRARAPISSSTTSTPAVTTTANSNNHSTSSSALPSVHVESPVDSPSSLSPASATPTNAQFRVSGSESFVTAPSLRPQLSGTSAYSRLSVWDDEEDVPPDEDWAGSVLQEAARGWAERRRSRMSAQVQAGLL
ncbi:RhoGAP-domain-containing protein [Dentipellis sp. KUC8613]|nr:RhoGAP-domain-containing protein [Dentipellis sp. KUC8613]